MSRKFRCVHIADVHFRGLSRHEQYKKSFTDFFEQMEKVKPDVIFVGGDIVHSKTQGISPELIDVLSWWFRGLSRSATNVHVILGNHDGLLLNKERQDAITPILSALGLSNVHLHKASGVYETHIPGFNFCVFSCFDEVGWGRVTPVSGDVNIACFHGSVVGSLTDIDWELDGEVETSFFDAFDFAFLGDIHRKQFMGRDSRVAYCGSSIQQNFGEAVEKGYLLWDIDDRDNFDVSFHEIENESQFVTIEWKDAIQDTLDHADIPAGARVRVQSKRPIQQASWSHLRNFMKEHYGVNELVYDLRRDPAQVMDVDTSSNARGENFRDFATLSKYMGAWLESIDCSVEESVRAVEYLKKIHDQVPAPDCLRNARWSIDSMRFDNLYSYGRGNQIDFNTLRGVVGIFGKNRTGKSSIPGTIMYGLFNGSDRGAIKNIHIINARKDHCKASIDITVNGTRYRIERQSVKKTTKAGKQHAVTHMNCFQIDHTGEVVKDMSEEQRRETEKIVRSLVGTADNFLLTSFASQGAMNSFIKERATNRKSILTSFLDFTTFDELNKITRQDLATLRGKLSDVQKRDFGSLEHEKVKDLTESQLELKTYEKLRRETYRKLQTVQSKLSQLPSELVTQSDVDAQETKIEELKQTRVNLVEEKANCLQGWRDKKEKASELRNVVEVYDPQRLREQLHTFEKIGNEISGLQKTLSGKKQAERVLENSVSALDEVPCGDLFPTCKFITSAHESKTDLTNLRNSMDEVRSRLVEFSSAISEEDIVALRENLEKIDAINEKADAIERDIKNSLGKVNLYDEKMKVTEDRISFEETCLEKMLEHVSTDPENNILDELKVEKRSLEDVSRDHDSKCIAMAKAVGRLQSEIEQLRQERERFDNLTSEWRIVELVSEAVSKKGIPLSILGRKLPQVNEEIAQILQGCTGFTVELEADQESNAMDIYINYGDSRRIIECASGMEKMMASLAIRVALMNLTALPRCDLLIIDEGFGALDETNVEACSGLLHNLKKWFKSILVISHVDAVKDSVDNVIEISKRGQDSYVNTYE